MALSKIESQALDVGQIGGRRNLIINGAMQVAQRGTSFTFSNGNNQFVVDRFQASENGTPSFVFTVSQDTDAPSNFKQSVKFDCTTAESSLAVGARATFRQKIEAQDLQSLAYGTADAQSITLSFWVKTNVTGTYTVWFYNEDGNRQTTNTFSISAQDTWERKTVLISPDTVGSINNDNGTGLQIEITLAAGTNYTTGTALNGEWETGTTTVNRSVGQTANLASSTSNYFNITGVQLEVGSVATPFEHRSYGEELALCQRYYQKSYDIDTVPGTVADSGRVYNTYLQVATLSEGTPFATAMRAAPTVVIYSPNTGASGKIANSGDKTAVADNSNNHRISRINITSGVTGATTHWHYTADAEL